MQSDYERIEKAILFLQDHVYDQPTLEEVAENLHLSPYHFQRLFKRWAGISPKRFLQFLTLDYAKQLLRENRNSLETTYRAGLSSPSRLHDLFVAVDAVTPGEYKAQGSGLEILYGIHRSPFGRCLVALTDRGLCALSFVEAAEPQAALDSLHRQWPKAVLKDSSEGTEWVIRRVFGPLQQDDRSSIPLLLKGTNFQIKVWEALLRIPTGSLTSYQNLARTIGKPTASRAVGSAVGANPIAYLIPCHRVIRSTGAFGNYRYGAVRKKAILLWERAQLQQAHRSALRI
jgi:AraC family transcriptional regulator of adaptative response/methylated-DNA-[protein]-cysteine methyltransferase